ncbi:MAG TPA: helix-turn-helix domain-containing protein [Tepidisphaeraceae bacterium]|nr:helix-turn-helix domain-containing protein [Tepidisphaeraceae bacterium]
MDDPGRLLTPKDLADAIGASESSVRRWVDAGRVRMSRTAGGHRRIPLAEAIRFVRETGATVVRPDLLALGDLTIAPATPGRSAAAAGSGDEPLFAALAAGDRDAATSLIVSAYVRGQDLPALFDGPIRSAFHRLGELWRHEARGILVEHRAVDLCVAALARLRDLLPAPDPRAPLALGGAPAGDPYVLPSLIAGMTLAHAGFRDVNFGPDTPLDLLAREAVDRGARLVWVSASAAGNPTDVRAAVEALAAVLVPRGIALAVGGSRSSAFARAARVAPMNSMSELTAFARGLLVTPAPAKPRPKRKPGHTPDPTD